MVNVAVNGECDLWRACSLVLWSWKNEHGGWAPYPVHVSAGLEQGVCNLRRRWRALTPLSALRSRSLFLLRCLVALAYRSGTSSYRWFDKFTSCEREANMRNHTQYRVLDPMLQRGIRRSPPVFVPVIPRHLIDEITSGAQQAEARLACCASHCLCAPWQAIVWCSWAPGSPRRRAAPRGVRC